MLVAGGRWLSLHKGTLNELNVFPVPDGDTGTNMAMTMRGALLPLLSRPAPTNLGQVSRDAAKGALLGARGNSGVILSQILHGFASGLQALEKADPEQLAQAFIQAKNYAYSSVQQPREGTILTVIGIVADHAVEIAHSVKDLESFFAALSSIARQELFNCKDLLPVLKDAGVVDAGGLGLVYMFEGMQKVAGGGRLTTPHNSEDSSVFAVPAKHVIEDAIEFGYCTEFLVEGTDLTPDQVRPHLEELGNSIVLARTEDFLKVHIHTNSPDLVELLVTPGCRTFRRKVEDMREQNKARREDYSRGISPAQKQAGTAEYKGELQLIEPPCPERLETADLPSLVAIANGEGLVEYLQSWHIEIVPGGQTLNPSTSDILAAIERCAQRHELPDQQVVVFANNGNCAAACNQAARLCQVPVRVIANKCPVQLVAWLNSHLPTPDRELAQINEYCFGEVTQAVKDAVLANHRIESGDYMSIWNGELVQAGDSFVDSVLGLVEHRPKLEFSRLVIIAGRDCDPDSMELLLSKIIERYPGVGVEFLWGGQPHHSVLVTLE